MADKWIQLQSADGVDNLFPKGQYDLLYTNSALTTSFSGQTIPLSLNEDDILLIDIKWATNDATYITVILRVGSGTIVNYFYSGKYYRKITATTSGVTFGDCMANTSMTGTMATNNSGAIPMNIYRFKGNMNSLIQ